MQTRTTASSAEARATEGARAARLVLTATGQDKSADGVGARVLAVVQAVHLVNTSIEDSGQSSGALRRLVDPARIDRKLFRRSVLAIL
jgi:hypothetical protein